jgi:hypothetical protein
LSSISSFAAGKVTTFHRLIIQNQNDQVMVVKIKDRDFWVTPGCYQNNSTKLNEGMNANAAEYGLTISPVELRALFTLRDEKDDSVSTRNIFVAYTEGNHSKMPSYIDEIRWLSVEESIKLMTFPQISFALEQIFENPDQIMGGSLQLKKVNGIETLTIQEPIRALFNANK